jgi:hypothetical protein
MRARSGKVGIDHGELTFVAERGDDDLPNSRHDFFLYRVLYS